MAHRMRRMRWPALVVAGVLAAGGGTAYAVTSDGSADGYRTVRAKKGDVEQVLSTSGTVDAAHRADLAFGTDGTVASVKVAVGDRVKAGQVLATLDTDALEAAVVRAKADLARAVAQLEGDEDAQAQAVADAASQTPQPSTPEDAGTSSPSGNDSATAASLAALQRQQAAVVEAEHAASAAIAVAKDALSAQTKACADAYAEPGPDTTADDTTADGTTADAVPNDDACAAALAEVQARQGDVSDAQDALADALSTLSSTLSKALAALGSTGGGTAPGSTGTTARTTDSPSASSDTSTEGDAPASATPTAAQLASDQAAVEQARADLVGARQQHRQAVLRSTRSGKVVSLEVAKGDSVSAGDVAAVVVGGTAVTVETTVPESKIGQVRVGQHVRVSTPGRADPAEGTVSAIGLVADSSSGTASYPVTVTVEDPPIPLPAGSQAMLAIVVATAHDVVSVPISAISRRGDGATATVRTWDGKALSRQAVTTGAVGAAVVEITDGLAAGDQVVLADLDQEISGASDTINDGGGFGDAPVFRMSGKGPGGGPVTFRSGG